MSVDDAMFLDITLKIVLKLPANHPKAMYVTYANNLAIISRIAQREISDELIMSNLHVRKKNRCEKEKRRHHLIFFCSTVDSCWFCLSNPKVEKHLVASIGNELYVALAKGPLFSSKDEDCKVPGSGHALIIPITHYPTFGKIPLESQVEVVAELEKYKSAFRKMFEQHNHSLLSFEISRESFRGMSHAHIQIVAIPNSKCDIVEQVAREQGEMLGMDFIDQVPVR